MKLSEKVTQLFNRVLQRLPARELLDNTQPNPDPQHEHEDQSVYDEHDTEEHELRLYVTPEEGCFEINIEMAILRVDEVDLQDTVRVMREAIFHWSGHKRSLSYELLDDDEPGDDVVVGPTHHFQLNYNVGQVELVFVVQYAEPV